MLTHIEDLKLKLKDVFKKAYKDKGLLERWKVLGPSRNFLREEILGGKVDKEILKDFVSPGRWGNPAGTYWFMCKIKLPPVCNKKTLVLNISLTDKNHPVNPQLQTVKYHAEGQLYINGNPFCGLDPNHEEILLTKSGETGKYYNIIIEGYTKSSTLKNFNSKLLMRDNPVYRYYYDIKFLIDVFFSVGKNSQIGKQIIDIINYSLDEFDKSKDVANAREILQKFYCKLKLPKYNTCYFVGHSHIDMAWLWRISETRRKACRTFSTMFKFMEEYPEYIYAHSSPQLYEMVENDWPIIFNRIKKHIQNNRWEPLGTTWVEPDTNIPSGESLVRQILYGKKYFQERFNISSKVGWIIDSFGYTASLPQIFRLANIEYLFSMKLYENDTNKPKSTFFWWEGIDGSRILVYFPLAYSFRPNPKALSDWLEHHRGLRNTNVLLFPTGYGDGGGGITREHLEYSRRLNEVPLFPHIKWTTVEKFTRIMKKFSHKAPVYQGELYFENHRGTYTSVGMIKTCNRKLEILLRNVEILTTLGAFKGMNYPSWKIETLWKILLLYQFHDILAGSSIPEVYEDAKEDLKKIQIDGEEILKRSLNIMVPEVKGGNKMLFVFNSLSSMRSEIVSIPGKELPGDFILQDPDGKEIPYQRSKNLQGESVVLFIASNVPAFGYIIYSIIPQKTNVRYLPVSTDSYCVENKFFKITFTGRGTISSIIDKRKEKEILESGKEGNAFQTFYDVAKICEAWNIEKNTLKKPCKIFQCKSIKIHEAGPVYTSIRAVFAGGKSKIIQDCILYNELPRIDFLTSVDWHEKRILLKVAFPVAVQSNIATYEIAFGVIQRSTRDENSYTSAQFEVPAHRFADVSDNNYGVSLLNDSKYGYDIKGNIMRLTLLRSPAFAQQTDKKDSLDFIDKPHAFTDQGKHFLKYSIFPHIGSWEKGGAVLQAHSFNNHLITRIFQGDIPLNQRRECFIKLNRDNIIIDTLKYAEDKNGFVFRTYETYGIKTLVKIEFNEDFELEKVIECNLIEEFKRNICIRNNGFDIKYNPFEIKSFRIEILDKMKKRGNSNNVFKK